MKLSTVLVFWLFTFHGSKGQPQCKKLRKKSEWMNISVPSRMHSPVYCQNSTSPIKDYCEVWRFLPTECRMTMECKWMQSYEHRLPQMFIVGKRVKIRATPINEYTFRINFLRPPHTALHISVRFNVSLKHTPVRNQIVFNAKKHSRWMNEMTLHSCPFKYQKIFILTVKRTAKTYKMQMKTGERHYTWRYKTTLNVNARFIEFYGVEIHYLEMY